MKSKWIRAALALATLASALALAPAAPAAAAGGGGEMYEPAIYSVKFLCGHSNGRIVSKGHYTTALNVFNYGAASTVLRLHSAQTGQHLDAGPVSKILEWSIGPGQAIVITCEDIWWLNRHEVRDHYKHMPCEDKKGRPLPPKKCKRHHYHPFFDGFIVLEASADLQVIALNDGYQMPVEKRELANNLG